MNENFENFCDGMSGLTNAEALTEIIKKKETISRREQMNLTIDARSVEIKLLLINLYNKVDNLNRGELFSKDNS